MKTLEISDTKTTAQMEVELAQALFGYRNPVDVSMAPNLKSAVPPLGWITGFESCSPEIDRTGTKNVWLTRSGARNQMTIYFPKSWFSSPSSWTDQMVLRAMQEHQSDVVRQTFIVELDKMWERRKEEFGTSVLDYKVGDFAIAAYRALGLGESDE